MRARARVCVWRTVSKHRRCNKPSAKVGNDTLIRLHVTDWPHAVEVCGWSKERHDDRRISPAGRGARKRKAGRLPLPACDSPGGAPNEPIKKTYKKENVAQRQVVCEAVGDAQTKLLLSLSLSRSQATRGRDSYKGAGGNVGGRSPPQQDLALAMQRPARARGDKITREPIERIAMVQDTCRRWHTRATVKTMALVPTPKMREHSTTFSQVFTSRSFLSMILRARTFIDAFSRAR